MQHTAIQIGSKLLGGTVIPIIQATSINCKTLAQKEDIRRRSAGSATRPMSDAKPPVCARSTSPGWLPGLGMLHKQRANCALPCSASWRQVIVSLSSKKEQALALRDSVHRRSLLPKRHTVSRCTLNVILLTPVTKARPDLSRFARNSEILNRIMCVSAIPSFTEIGKSTWKVRINLRPYANHLL